VRGTVAEGGTAADRRSRLWGLKYGGLRRASATTPSWFSCVATLDLYIYESVYQ
jgi:hypothetical protein